MATDKLITMKQFNGTDYDTLYPKTIASQVDGVYNKQEVIKDATKSMFGYGSSAIPDTIFQWLGKYNLHWWRRRTVQAVLGEAATVMAYSSSGSNSGTAYYSDSYIINGNGEIELVNPSTVNIGYVYYTGYNTLKGKYFYTTGTGQMLNGRIWFMPSDAPNATRGDDGPNGYYVNITAAELTLLNGDVEYITAPSQDAYPYSGYADGYLYEYLGIPFENAVNGAKIETGSYIGTGTYGSSNPCSFAFDFVPSLLIISSSDGSAYLMAFNYGNQAGLMMTNGSWYAFSNNNANIKFTWDKTVSWYSTKSALIQLNNSGTEYVVCAFR